jgi:hypothetical protein
MARKPKAAVGHNSGGPTKGDILAADTELMEAARESKEAAARLGAVKKRLGKSGIDVAEVVALQKLRSQDEAARLAKEATKRRYASWMNVNLTDDGAQEPDADEGEATSSEEQAHRESLAGDAGYRCGRLGTDRHAGNTYPQGTPMFDAFDRGWLRGQESLAMELGPDVKVADASRQKPGEEAA